MTKRRQSERITQQQNRPCVNRYSDGCEFDRCRCTWWQHDDDDDNNINNNRNKMRHTTTTTARRVFYGCILNAIGTWLRNWGDQGLPWHDIAVERRHPKSATSSTWHQIDYSSANMTINSRWAPQSSSMHICQTQMRHDYETRSIICSYNRYGGRELTSWPLRSTNRLQQCYHDDPLLRSPSNFVYACIPNTNAPYLKNLRQLWRHHTRYGGREITSRPATALILGTPRRVLHLLHDYWNLQSGSIMYTKHKCTIFEESGPS